MMKTTIFLVFWMLAFSHYTFAQCCAGGSGSPIAGGTSQGVLKQNQFELNSNYQFISSDKFFTGDIPDTNKYFDSYSSSYQYLRLAYGATENLTMSVELGYFFKKEEVGLENDPSKTYNSSGIGDLIIFPRYTVLNSLNETSKTEITVGLGYKIPLGAYNDSTGNLEPFSGTTYYVTNPQAVQPSSGAQDIIFYLFLFKGYPAKDFRIFANSVYIKKGWNPIGEKQGDFASFGLFAGKTLFDNLGLTLQTRFEWTDVMQLNNDIYLYAYPNYDPYATGYKKVFLSPQISYSYRNVTVYGLIDLPVYQYVTKTQVGTQLQATVGFSYRFFAWSNQSKGMIEPI